MTDLNLGKCDFALATQKGVDFYDGFNTKRIATKYPNITKHILSLPDTEFAKPKYQTKFL
jgi:ATP phosphoribosyltransferase